MDRTRGEGGGGGGWRQRGRGGSRRGRRRGGVRRRGGDSEADVVLCGRKEMSQVVLLHVDWNLEGEGEAERKM